MAGPVALGAASGHLGFGMAASVGGLALGVGGEDGSGTGVRARAMAATALAGASAMLVGASIARLGGAWEVSIAPIAGIAALLGGIGRTLAVATTQFTVLAIMATGFAAGVLVPWQLALLFLAGAAWTACVALALDWGLRAIGRAPAPAGAAAEFASPPASLADRYRRWRRSLFHWPAWQYPARIAASLGAAEALALLFPGHHGYWAALTVSLVVRRRTSDSVMRAVQRGLGTLCGVLVSMLLLLGSPPIPVLVAMVGILSALRPILVGANYAAYATAMTPLIMLLLDLGRTPSLATMLDRLAATALGCAIALTVGYAIWPRMRTVTPSSRPPE